MVPDKKKSHVGDVLIIDDNADICEILKIYCENMGCFRNIILAHDGISAGSKLRNQKFVLILLDLEMPKKGGIDVLSEMDDKSLNSKNSVVIVSGALDKEKVEKLIEIGARSFLPKPVGEADFQIKILKLLSLK